MKNETGIIEFVASHQQNHLTKQQEEVANTVSEFCSQQDVLSHVKNLDLLLNSFMESEEFEMLGQDTISSVVYSATTVKTYLMELQEKTNKVNASQAVNLSSEN